MEIEEKENKDMAYVALSVPIISHSTNEEILAKVLCRSIRRLFNNEQFNELPFIM